MLTGRETQLWLAAATIVAVTALVALISLWGRLNDTREQFEALTEAHRGLAGQVDAQAEWAGYVHERLWGDDPAGDDGRPTGEHDTVEADAADTFARQEYVRANGSTAAGRHRHRVK